jgi:hypothetical protein
MNTHNSVSTLLAWRSCWRSRVKVFECLDKRERAAARKHPYPFPMHYPCVSPFSFQSTQMAPNRLRNSSRRVVPYGGKTCGCVQNCKRCSLCYSAPAPRDPASFLATAFSFNWLGIKIVTRARAQSSGACFNPHRLQLLPLRRVYMKPNAAPAVRVQQNEPTRLCAHTVCLELPLERPVARCMRDLMSV